MTKRTPTLMVGIDSFFGSRAVELGYIFAGVMLVSVPMIIMFPVPAEILYQGYCGRSSRRVRHKR